MIRTVTESCLVLPSIRMLAAQTVEPTSLKLTVRITILATHQQAV